MSRVVALFAAPRADDAAATEFLRTLVALRALEVSVALFEAGPGRGVLSGDPILSPDGDRYLEALASDGVVPSGGVDWGMALSTADAVLVLADPARPGAPPVLRLQRGKTPDAVTLTTLLQAGQVVMDMGS
jgi:hypothetical protein